MGVDDSGDGVGGVVEAVHKLEGQRDQERQAQEDVRLCRQDANAGEVVGDAGADKDEAADEHSGEDQCADFARLLGELLVNRMFRWLLLLGGDWWRRRYRCCCSGCCC